VKCFPFSKGGDIGSAEGHQLRRRRRAREMLVGNEWEEEVGLR
jgi:hypothetical protein